MGFKPDIIQYAWVVSNLEEAIHHWHRTLGVGPFLVNRELQISEPRHRGQPRAVRFSTAVAQSGSAQIELVEQHDDGPSAFRDTVPEGETRLHHVAIVAADYEATLARYADVAVAADGRFGDIRFAYLDTSATLGAMLEVLDDKPGIRAFFGAIRKAAERWDGDPATLIREL
ncbi:MAG: ABC transporter permease [Sphingomonadales bacterium]|nr:MAG: ABC transporter permease [Sphingomonadales bacterium]